MANHIDIDFEVEQERKLCKCDQRMIRDEGGNMLCSIKCGGCRHYDVVELRCDIRDDVVCTLNEYAQYNRTIAADHY